MLARVRRLPADGLPVRLAAAERRLTDAGRRALRTDDVAGLRGIEGEAAMTYFGVFDCLVRVDGDALRFRGRSRRPQ